jgi:soluble lytic murein transglycosylase
MFFALLRKKRVFALLFISLIGLLFYSNDWLGRWIYPIHYQDEISIASSQSQLDPFLVTAIIRVESNFKSDKISSKGAIGLMQIMPDTAEWITDLSAGSSKDIASRLTIPEVNIQIGIWYVSSLQKQFEQRLATMESNQDRIALVAAAYNAGPGNVNKWLQEGIWDGSYGELALIPFGETRHFVQRILYYYKKHERYYSEIWYNRES